MSKKMATLLIMAAMAGMSCMGNAQNNNGENTNQNDTTAVMEQDANPQVAAEDSICDNPDVRPKYAAKDVTSFMLDFMNKNMRYPEEAVEKKLEGTVVVQMVVEKDGTPTHFEVIRGIDPILDDETLRVAKLLPKFVPAQKDGKPVRCLFNFSVPYRLK